jgi:hypothetical protein
VSRDGRLLGGAQLAEPEMPSSISLEREQASDRNQDAWSHAPGREQLLVRHPRERRVGIDARPLQCLDAEPGSPSAQRGGIDGGAVPFQD